MPMSFAERGRHATVTFMMYDKAAHAGRSVRAWRPTSMFSAVRSRWAAAVRRVRAGHERRPALSAGKGKTYTFRYENSRGEAAQVTAEVGDAPLTVTGYME